MRITIFGANGGTGRVLVRQALDAGHEVVAVTRRPGEFPLTHPRLVIAGADVRDRQAVCGAVEGSEAVLSSLGVPFTRKPVTVYSEGVSVIATAMSRLGVKRIAVVSSTAVEPHRHAEGGFMLNRVMQPLVSATIGKTTYADMRVMEDILRRSDLDWTVVRSAGLFEAGRVSSYQVSDGPLDGVFTSREDLAACLLAQASDSRFAGKAIEVTTSERVPTLWQMIRREAFKKD
jgi:nucleoside-diphosphate-sugar epimerase